MNWISALGPIQWLLLLAVPPAVLSLYFLKLKRKEFAVPSTLLWRKTLEDVHVNSLWQKLRKNLLLYLQLLFLAALILACLRPGWSGQSRIGERRIYIIDNSASMQATDVAPSRLEDAKEKVRKLISDTAGDDVGMIIAFSDRADVRQGFTKDRNRLLSALDSIRPTDHATDISEALRAAAGLANPGRSSFDDLTDIVVADAITASAYVFSDGAFGDLGDLDLGKLNITYVPIGQPETSNVGVLNFAIQRNETDANKLEVFARVVNHGKQDASFTASLELDGKLVDAALCEVKAGNESGIVFELNDVEQGLLKLQLDHQDALPVDNVAYAAVRPAKPVSVLLITPGNSALESALQTSRVQQIASVRIETPGFLDSPTYLTDSQNSLFDLVVFDQCSPKVMPASNTLFIGTIPPKIVDSNNSEQPSESKAENQDWQFSALQGPTIILDVNRSNSITQYLEMASTSIVEARTVTPPESGTILMTADIGPIFSIAPRGPFQDAVLGFSIVQSASEGVVTNTDWGRKRSFPVFVYSAVEFLGGGISESSAPTVQPGWPIGLQLSTRYKDFHVLSPDGSKTELSRGQESRFIYTQTHAQGTYQVYADGLDKPIEAFCVNLFSNRESNLEIAQDIKMGFEKVAATGSSIHARQETWRWLLLVGLVLLVGEWVVFNRRIFV